jgi:hypothetical protein
MEALAKIGNESFGAVIEAITLTDDILTLTLLLQVIKSVCKYRECSRAVLAHTIGEEAKPDRKAKLQNALANLDKLRVDN